MDRNPRWDERGDDPEVQSLIYDVVVLYDIVMTMLESMGVVNIDEDSTDSPFVVETADRLIEDFNEGHECEICDFKGTDKELDAHYDWAGGPDGDDLHKAWI